MFDPWYNMRRYLVWTFILIVFLIVTGVAVAKDYTKIVPINPDEVNGQFCYIKITIKEVDNEIIKEEILECADGRKRFDGPSYWDLFAEFYYTDINTPPYCRKYDRKNHAFKSFGTICLTKNGDWEVK